MCLIQARILIPSLLPTAFPYARRPGLCACHGSILFHPPINRYAALQKLLYYDPKKRISAKRALEHPFFDDLDKTDLLHN